MHLQHMDHTYPPSHDLLRAATGQQGEPVMTYVDDSCIQVTPTKCTASRNRVLHPECRSARGRRKVVQGVGVDHTKYFKTIGCSNRVASARRVAGVRAIPQPTEASVAELNETLTAAARW